MSVANMQCVIQKVGNRQRFRTTRGEHPRFLPIVASNFDNDFADLGVGFHVLMSLNNLG